MMHNPRTEQYLTVGDPVTVADPVSLHGARTVVAFDGCTDEIELVNL